MGKTLKVIITILISFTLISCGDESDKSNKIQEIKYYEEFDDVIDFGHLSGIDPLIEKEDSDLSVTYLYDIRTKLDQDIFKVFGKSLKDNNYKHASETRISDDGGRWDLLENDKNQIILGEYAIEEGFTNKLIISVRPKYMMYKEVDTVPDFGYVANQKPTETLFEDDVYVYIYETLVESDYTKYSVALGAHGFVQGEMVLFEDGYVVPYTNDEYNVLIGLFPTFLSVTIGQ